MLPIELKLTSLGHCYVHLPDTFVQKETDLRSGSKISIRSVQNDTELIVLWNGNLSVSSSYAQLDLVFAQANNLKDELVVLCLADKIETSDCVECHVELVNASDYAILSQHSEANLLDSCRLITRELVIPIYFSQHINILVKVLRLKPDSELSLLNAWTELHFHHDSSEKPSEARSVEAADEELTKIVNHIPFLSCSLGIEYVPKFHLGSMLVCGSKGSGKTHYLKSALNTYQKYNGKLFNCQQLRGKRPESIKKLLNELFDEAFEKQPSIIALDDIDSILLSDAGNENEKGQDAIYKKRVVSIFCQMLKQIERSEHVKGQKVVVIASCRGLDELDSRISKSIGRKYFNEILKLEMPNLKERCVILETMLSEQKQVKSNLNSGQIESIAKRCSSFMPSDLRILVERSVIASCSRSSLDFTSESPSLDYEDLDKSIENYVPYNLRQVNLQAKSMRTFEHVGGMRQIIDELRKTILMQVKYPKLYRKSPVKPQNSILLYGPPGCGKTLVAEALTNQDCINSICVRGPELLSKYIGASEAAVRDLFKRAELARPCIIFFDEFESLVARRGSDSTGVTDRVVNQFLTLMDGVEQLSNDVFIVAATSRPDIIDPAMLRPGRLDKHIYCPIPENEDRFHILKVLSRDMIFEDNNREASLRFWSEQLDGFTGADIQSLLYSAQLKALHKLVGPTDFSTGKLARNKNEKNDDMDIVVSEENIREAYEEMKSDVESKLIRLISQHPRAIGKTGIDRIVATRATLA